MPGFSVRPETHDDAVHLVLAGELDLAGAVEVQDAAAIALRDAPAALVLDLDALEFVDSSGIASLLNVSAQARAAGVTFRSECGPDCAARGVIATLGLHDNLGLVPA